MLSPGELMNHVLMSRFCPWPVPPADYLRGCGGHGLGLPTEGLRWVPTNSHLIRGGPAAPWAHQRPLLQTLERPGA